jgi:hypothetical protein
MRTFNLIAGLVLAVVAAPLVAQPITQKIETHDNAIGEVEKSGDTLQHRASRYVFPMTLGALPIRDTTTYGPGDASAYYTDRGGGNADPWLTLYVYPATVSLEQDQQVVEASIKARWSVKSIAAPTGVVFVPGAADGWFDGALNEQSFLTGYRIVRSGDWFIKARLSVPRKGGEPAVRKAVAALNAVAWTVPQALTARSATARLAKR